MTVTTKANEKTRKTRLTMEDGQTFPADRQLSITFNMTRMKSRTVVKLSNLREAPTKQDHQRWGYSTVERFAKRLNKDKRQEQRNNYILIWGGSSSVSIFYAGLRRSGCAYVGYVADMKVADTLWTSTNSLLTSTDSRRTSTDFY